MDDYIAGVDGDVNSAINVGDTGISVTHMARLACVTHCHLYDSTIKSFYKLF